MPTTYRKKPVEIEAVPYDGNNGDEIVAWIDDHTGASHTSIDEKGAHLLIYTLEGVMRADVGDYVIRGIKGEFYPCKPDIFEASYDAIVTAEIVDEDQA